VTSAANPAVPFFDLSDPRFSVQSPEVRQAREHGWYARTNYGLAVLRYGQAARLIRHPALRQGSVAWPAHHGITTGPFAAWWANWVLNKEGADHQRLRRLLSPALSRRLVERMVPRLRVLAGELVDSFAEPGRCEFMSEFAEPYAARVIAIMLGIGQDQWRPIAADSATVGLAMGVQIRQHLPAIEGALARLYGRADALIADRRARPRDDFVTTLVQAEQAADRLTRDELRDSLVLLIFGGFDTTRNQLGLAMAVFLEHPAQWRLLARRPDLGPAAVEEVMRVRPTTTWVTREAVSDFSFDGLRIRAGTTIHLFCEAAGTDPAVFGPAASEGPEFDITVVGRPPHFGFGGGIHYCLGHLVARTDMAVALPLLARRLTAPRLAGPASWLPCSGNTGPARLPLAFQPGAGSAWQE
jgi:cytochrome P450